MAEVNATAAALLGLLREGPLSGYDAARTAQEVLGDFWTITRSQVYRELASMAERGFVQAEETGARDRQPYSLTDEGEQAFLDWMHATPGPDVVRIPLLLRLAFIDALEPEHLAALLEDQRAQHERRLASYEELAHALEEDSTPPRELATLRFGLRYEQAVLAWFDDLDVDEPG